MGLPSSLSYERKDGVEGYFSVVVECLLLLILGEANYDEGKGAKNQQQQEP